MFPGIMIMTLCQGLICAQQSEIKGLEALWEDLNLDSRYHVGLMVMDVEKQKIIFDYKSDNFFTPASNIKLLTAYAALQCIPDSLVAGYYEISGDSLIIWGGGDPGTYNPDIPMPSALVDLIQKSDRQIYFCDRYFQTGRFGKGWAWDDYPFSYQCERNAFPIYGNRLWIDRQVDSIHVFPAYLKPLLTISKDTFSDSGKSEFGETYFYVYDGSDKSDFDEIPITFFKNDLRFAWMEATKKEIQFIDRLMPPDAIPVTGSPRDSLIRYMLMESDNFIAEQLLLAGSMNTLGYMNEEVLIDSLLLGSLNDLPDQIAWVDGSGLSRYNLLTPRTLVTILSRIVNTRGTAFLQHVLPAGGKSGTMQYGYKLKKGKPYIFAKTGSLKYTQCLSGLIRTASGKVLLFSWMNNQYPGSSADIRTAMDKFFSFLYDEY